VSDDSRPARFERGVEVLAWNGVPIVRAIEINGESQAGSNPDARFARGLDNLTIVSPDVLHLMTRHDLLDDNVDLLARAARLIRQQPSFQLSLKPATGQGGGGIVVSATSTLPSSKPGRGISRLDIYVNGRPMLSMDAEDGAVPPTPVSVGRVGHTRTAVEAQAWDRSGKLVAVSRTTL
jgi:hypothetical protein